MKTTTLRVGPLISQVQLFDAIVSNTAISKAVQMVVDAIESPPQESENADK